MVSFKQRHANGNNAYNKPFTIRIEQIFRCFLKITAYHNFIFRETPGLLLSLKEQKTQDDSWFYCKQVQKMPLRTPPEKVVYQGQVDKGEVLPRHRYKERRILLINTVAFSYVKLN